MAADMKNTNTDNIESCSSSSSSASSIEIITKLGANLVRQLLADADILFLSQPLTVSR
jgi:hypothetical protein